MNNAISSLVPVTQGNIGNEPVQTVNARSLHTWLEVASEFRNWIKNRITQYGFTQDVDFVAGNFLPGTEQIDYHITLDMAKELAMVERNTKGKEARQYFIECERRANAQQQQHPLSLAAADAPNFNAAAAAFGFVGNQRMLSANNALRTVYGVDLLQAMGASALPAPDNEPLLTATDLAKRLNIKSTEANPLLTNCGLQTSHRDHKERLYYELTDSGQQYGTYLDTGKRDSGGTPIRQIKWKASILPLLEDELELLNQMG